MTSGTIPACGEHGTILPLVLAVVVLIGLIQLRVQQRLDLYTRMVRLRSESIQAGLTAQNGAFQSHFNSIGPPQGGAAISTNRLASVPLRWETTVSAASAGVISRRFGIDFLRSASADLLSLPNWRRLKRDLEEVNCPADSGRNYKQSFRSCSISAIDLTGGFPGAIFYGNLISENRLTVKNSQTGKIRITAIGDIKLNGGIEIRSTESFQLEIIGIGSIKIKEIKVISDPGREVTGAVLIHSSRGSIEIEQNAGLELCDNRSAGTSNGGLIRLSLHSFQAATIGGNRYGSNGQAGCPAVLNPPEWIKERLVGAGPLE